MPDPGSILTSGAILLLVVIMVAFAIGTQRNIAKGNKRLAWLQAGLPELGRRTTLRWLGSSAVQLDLVDPVSPFREVTVLYVLEPRDVPLLWLFTRARGRRDVLIVRASLRRAPRLELEAAAPGAWLTASDAEEAAEWPAVAFPGGISATAAEGADPADVEAARRAWARLAATSAAVWRLSVRQTVPHLEVHVRPADAATPPAGRMIEAIRDLAGHLSPG